MRKSLAAVAAATMAVPLVALAGSATAGTTAGTAAKTSTDVRYVVVYRGEASAAHQALSRLGATLVSENTDVGVATVTTRNARFASQATGETTLFGVADDTAIGRTPAAAASGRRTPSAAAQEKAESSAGVTAGAKRGSSTPGAEPLSGDQWDMRAIGATPTGSYKTERGSRGVLVGVIDTGIDGNHPDIKPNFDRSLSRNFVKDIPNDTNGQLLDGPCEHPSCIDPVDEDDGDHGTHVASTIASPLNGIGIGGVAPNVRLVNIRAGQDSGYFFLQPTVDALTYAGKSGIDVVNMSYFVDPWLFNCRANPADSPQEQADQRTIIEATQRALRFARDRGVTLVAASGNEQTDLGHPTEDSTSPDYPQTGAAKTRQIDDSCLSMPTEADGVIVVNAVGPSGRLSYYSNYGVEQTNVSAPGGDRREFFGTPQYNAPNTRVLAAYPKNVGIASGRIDAAGNPTDNLLVKSTSKGVTSYYQYLQGTSMASPHAAGVAALIVSRYGHRDFKHGGLTLSPRTVQQILEGTATKTPCPAVNPFVYPDPELAGYTPLCQGTTSFNGFFGHGVVSAQRAVAGH